MSSDNSTQWTVIGDDEQGTFSLLFSFCFCIHLFFFCLPLPWVDSLSTWQCAASHTFTPGIYPVQPQTLSATGQLHWNSWESGALLKGTSVLGDEGRENIIHSLPPIRFSCQFGVELYDLSVKPDSLTTSPDLFLLQNTPDYT